MKKIIQEDRKCSGCGACYNACPTNAISMQQNEEGFLYPVVDETKCSNCGLCKNICPVINLTYKNKSIPKCYAFKATNKIRQKSTSGGAFAVLAKHFIENEGYVAGAIWTDDFLVKHIVSNKIEDIEKMKKSKYLQSEIGDCYKKIKQLLESNIKVLFSGTPCQVAGLKAYLKKDYDNLFSLDLVCHGVPSSKVFQKYLQELLDNNEQILSFDFRHKKKNSDYKNTNINNTNYVKIITNKKINEECYSNNSFTKLIDISNDLW